MEGNHQNDFPALSFGAIKKILEGEHLESVVLQILGYKKIPGTGNDRFRLLLNDGVNLFSYAVLYNQLNYHIERKNLEKYTIFKLKNYVCSQLLPGKRVLICLDIEVLSPGSLVNNKISKLNHNQNSELSTTQQVQDNNDFAFATTQPCSSFNSCNVKNSKCNPKSVFVASSTSVEHEQNWDTGSWNLNGCVSQKNDKSVLPIISLTPYQSKWTIKARVIYKASLVNYHNQRGSGKYFSFYLLDDSGEIRVTAFNELAEKLNTYIVLNNVYYIANAVVKPSKDKFAMKSDFELTVSNNTKIEHCVDNVSCIPFLKFHFIPIRQIISCPKNSLIDVIGVCNSISELKTIVSKTDNKEILKRDMQLLDESETAVTVALWGIDAENFKQTGNPIIAIRNAKVTDFLSCSLSVSATSMIFYNPVISETCTLKAWFDALSESAEFQSISSSFSDSGANNNLKTFAEVITDHNNSDKPFYFAVKAYIVLVQKERCMYQACPSADCLKKVTDLNDGSYKCDKCNKVFNSYNWTLFLSLNLADFTTSHWATAFKETAESIIGVKSSEFGIIKETDEDKYNTMLSDLHFKSFIFKMRCKTEIYNENARLKSTILSVSPVEPLSYTKKLMCDIKRMANILRHF